MKKAASGSIEKPSPVAGGWWRTYIVTAGVAVVHVDLTTHPAREAEAYAWLDQGERDSWSKYLPAPRRQFVLCRAALRAILCSWLDCRNEQLSLGLSGYGKPFAVVRGENSPVNFNVSHSGGHGLIALSATRRLGVDIEERSAKRSLAPLIEEVMGPDEQAELHALHGSEKLHRFYRLWTFKEALIKALGTGFSTAPSQFQVPQSMRWGDAVGAFRFPHLQSVTWGLEEIGNQRFAAALAYEAPEKAQT